MKEIWTFYAGNSKYTGWADFLVCPLNRILFADKT